MTLRNSLLLLSTIWGALALFSVAIGSVFIPVDNIIKLLVTGGITDNFILWNHRIPRLFIATLVGMALAVSGNLVHAVVRNPLASPDILGVTAAASFSVVLLFSHWPDAPQYWAPLSALIGGLLSAGILLLITYRQRTLMPPARLALVGLALSAIFAAGADYLLTVNPIEVNSAMLWMTGSVWGRNWSHLPLILPGLLILIPAALYISYRLDLLGLGAEAATSFGINVSQTRIIALLMAIALASLSVSVCGAIGFIGIVAPHLARVIVGGRHFASILVSLLLGALLLVVADIAARAIAPPTEFPTGIFVAIIGAPYFLLLITRYKHW